MKTDMKEARYVLAVVQAVMSGKLPLEAITAECPECEEVQGSLDNDHHLVCVRGDGELEEVVVIIGCEGYWVVDPKLVGIDSPDWQPADAGLPDEMIV